MLAPGAAALLLKYVASPARATVLKLSSGHALLINSEHTHYLSMHIRLSTLTYGSGLACCFGTDIITATALTYVFARRDGARSIVVAVGARHSSIHSLYYNATWYERESAEMLGLTIRGLQDCRKLLLTYNNTISPLKKSILKQAEFIRVLGEDSKQLQWNI